MKNYALTGVVVLLLVSLLAGVGYAENVGGSQQRDVSFKAGPTTPSEGLSLVWLETVVYPRIVERAGQLSLFARMPQKVKAVTVSFDFDDQEVNLVSSDGMAWTCFYTVPDKVIDGVHVARFKVTGQNERSVVRTLDFFVDQQIAQALDSKESQLLAEREKGWEVSITADQAYLADEQGDLKGFRSFRKVNRYEKMVGLYKVPWYRVRFRDGTEGWVIASKVTEPTQELYQQGYTYFERGDFKKAAFYYSKALMVDPSFHKARYWLAKSYYRNGDEFLATQELLALLKADPGNSNVQVLATKLAQNYFDRAHRHFSAGRYQQAVIQYQKVVELKPSFITAQIELGQCFKKLGFDAKAREVWIAAFTFDPENAEIRALLNVGQTEVAELIEESTTLAQEEPLHEIPPLKVVLFEADSIKVVKNSITSKGTKVFAALSEVLNLTKSYGTLVREKGWQVRPSGDEYLVTFVCEQDRSGSGKSFVEEYFSWRVDQATQKIVPHNKNAKLLMSSW